MSTTFPRMRGRRLGYAPQEVEEFLAGARAAFDDRRGLSMTSADIRLTAFTMQRGGYATAAVDAALERLEDAFAARERELAVGQGGEREWYAGTRQLAREITARLDRQDGQRFDRAGFFRIGYNVADVDRFAAQARSYFEQGARVAVDQVRGVAFRPQRNGYREAQVDLLLDGLIEVMLAVR